MLGHLLGFLPVPGIHRRLAAAGLLRVIDRFDSNPAEQVDDGLSDPGREEIDRAGDKKGHIFHLLLLLPIDKGVKKAVFRNA
jgi:hypothetical protein